nr:hypothetical protein GCM10020063_003880 [Dactylosporangium thailandense]
MSALRRRYARLMLAYPARFRREYGPELLTVLLDRAGPGRARPTLAEARDLVLGGLRQRFRLPVGRLIVLAAVAAALTFGALGAGLGSVLGWTAAAARPADAVVDRAVELAAGGPVPHDRTVQSEDHGLRYQVQSTTPESVAPSWTLEEATARIEDAGWTVRSQSATPGAGAGISSSGVIAERDGLVLAVAASRAEGYPVSLSVSVTPAEPWPVRPLTLLGTLAGAAAGWLLTARAGYRLRRAGLGVRTALATLAVAAGLLLAPATLLAWIVVGYRVALAGTTFGADGRTLPAAYLAYTGNPFPVMGIAAGLALAALVVLGSWLGSQWPARFPVLKWRLTSDRR